MRAKSPKKTETIEVRVPHATKAAFMAKCRGDRRTASDAVRGFIEQELSATRGRPARVKLRSWQTVAAALAGLALGAAAAPSLARPTTNSRAAFERLDRNHDGSLSIDEFQRG